MSSTTSAHAPKQQRSRETLERLLIATIQVLDEHGLAGAVVPRIAALAGVVPASIYRRFKDKDALLRAAFLHMLRQSNDANRDRLESALLRDTLEASAEQLMVLLFDQYRQHPHLFRAIARFLDVDTDADFGREARAHLAGNVNQIAQVLLRYREEIRHPSPEQALQFAILSAGSSVEAIALEPGSLWNTVLPMSETERASELARSFVAYLRSD